MAGSQHFGAPDWAFWIISGAIGLALGGVGTASRAMVGAFTPAHRSAEFFGVWGMVNRLSAVLGIGVFSLITSLMQPKEFGQVVGLLAVGGFFAVGFVLMARIDQGAGLLAAREAEAEKGIKDEPA